MTTNAIITETATVIDEQGYRQGSGITVIADEDSIIIGRTEHRREDLNIDLDAHEITSKLAGWSVIW